MNGTALPHIISINVTDHSFMHLEKMLEYGLMEDDGTPVDKYPTGTQALGNAGDQPGRHGHKRIKSQLRALINGMYRVLSGATVTIAPDPDDPNASLVITITAPTNQTRYQELKDMETLCVNQINDINGPLDFQLVIEV